MAEGRRNREIAQALGVNSATVAYHLRQLLARLGRVAGIHLLIATQRPDPEVLPGQLLANVGASIAFGVRNFRDSETILREGDASAAFLPRVAGRGVYVFGMEREEFQTPFLSGEEARQRLEVRWPELRAPAVVLEERR